MSNPQLTIENPGEVQLAGLVNGGHVYMSCMNCRAGLADIYITRPFEPDDWLIKANCPFCGDKAMPVEIVGGFHPGGYRIPKLDDDPDDDITITIIEDIDHEDKVVTLKLIKASATTKPHYIR